MVVTAPRLPALDETLPGSAVDYLCGGKGGNQAVAAAQHGARTAMAGRVGDDEAGRVLLGNLSAAGVDTTDIGVATGERSGMSVAIVTESGDYGAVIVSAANLGLDAAAVQLREGTTILLLQNEVREAANAALAAQARARGVQVILNAAPARPFDTDLMSSVDLLIANRGESESLVGRSVDGVQEAQEAAAALAGPGREAVVTLGGEGAVFATEDAARHLPAPQVQVVSSHGAGDAFVGALAARLALGSDRIEALRYAQAAAALAVSLPPGERASIDVDDVWALARV